MGEKTVLFVDCRRPPPGKCLLDWAFEMFVRVMMVMVVWPGATEIGGPNRNYAPSR